MYDSCVVYRRTSSRRNLQRFHGRAQQSWDQFHEYDSERPRQQSPLLNKFQVRSSHQRSPYAVKFEDRSQEETERPERCARGDAWRLVKIIFQLKEREKATFFSPPDEWILPAASTKKLEERDFVVDSGASMHMVSRKDLNSAELETVWVSESPTTVVNSQRRRAHKRRGNSACQRSGFICDGEASRRYTGSSLTWKCEDHGFYNHWTSGQKPHLIKHGRKMDCKTANCVPFVAPILSTSSSSSSSPTSPTSSSQETVTPTEHPASTRSEGMSGEVRGNSSHGPAQAENPKKHDDHEEVRGNSLHDLPGRVQGHSG